MSYANGYVVLCCTTQFQSKHSAALAQLVEQFIRNEKVDSSIPSSGTKFTDGNLSPFAPRGVTPTPQPHADAIV